jgi:hypothetical protein
MKKNKFMAKDRVQWWALVTTGHKFSGALKGDF